VEKLKKLEYHFVGPTTGPLACKEEGTGRLESIDTILEEVLTLLEERKELKGKRILITLGRTKEYLDPIRYISNDSSGRFGIEIAKCARRRGAEVTIISGFTDIPIPSYLKHTHITSTSDMEDETIRALPQHDVLIMNAACSDFTPKQVKKDKIKKGKGDISISMNRTHDILSRLKPKKGAQTIVAFSLDTQNHLASAQNKMKDKNVDIMIANPAKTIGDLDVTMTVLTKKGKTHKFKNMSKANAAEKLIDIIALYI
jgi:phosphopantothenoylcysteine decarboxylase/phosphopantothenate--cysteine ligase